MSSACSRTWSPTAVYRSATNDPPYSRLAASSRGAMSTVTTSAPAARSRATADVERLRPAVGQAGELGRQRDGEADPAAVARAGRRRDAGPGSRQPPRGPLPSRVASGSAPSGPAITATARAASGTDRANTVTQSSDRQAGTTPVHGMRPRVGLRPTMPLRAAGTRPEPAVSVPRARSTRPSATATADPELEPPEIRVGIPRVTDRAVRAAGADEAGRELVEVGLAEHDRPGGPQPGDRRGVRGRQVRVRGRARRGGQPGHVDVVLDRRDQAGQRQLLSGGDRGVDRGGFGQGVGRRAQRDPDLGPVRPPRWRRRRR